MDQLNCQFCGRPAKSKSGLTNHEKTCQKRPAQIEGDMEEVDRFDDHNEEPVQERQERKSVGSKVSKSNPFQFGAFLVMADYIPILLDVDFCIALGNHILEHGSSNSAIMAFAHQLNKLDGD
jgi:hypothetical protein